MRGNNFVLFDKLPLKQAPVLNKCFNLNAETELLAIPQMIFAVVVVIVLWNDRSSNKEDPVNVHVIFDDQKSWLSGWLRFYCNIPGRYNLGGGGGGGRDYRD